MVTAEPFLFLIIGVTFMLFALPCFFLVRERGNPRPRPTFGWSMLRESTAETLKTPREGHRYPGLLRFLIGRVFYTDAINTVIAFMSIYTKNVAGATGLTKAQGEQQANLVLAAADHRGGDRRHRLGPRDGSHRAEAHVVTRAVDVDWRLRARVSRGRARVADCVVVCRGLRGRHRARRRLVGRSSLHAAAHATRSRRRACARRRARACCAPACAETGVINV